MLGPVVDFITISVQIQPKQSSFMGKTFILISFQSHPLGSFSLLLDSQAYVMWNVFPLEQLADTQSHFHFWSQFHARNIVIQLPPIQRWKTLQV